MSHAIPLDQLHGRRPTKNNNEHAAVLEDPLLAHTTTEPTSRLQLRLPYSRAQLCRYHYGASVAIIIFSQQQQQKL